MTKRVPGLAAIFTTVAVSATLVTSAGPVAADHHGTPDPPANLEVTDVGAESITVEWDPVEGATEYSVVVIPLEYSPDGIDGMDTDAVSATLDGLTWDLEYMVTVRAFVPDAYPDWWTETSAVTAKTETPGAYEPPSAPTNLRAERDSHGEITQIRWDHSTGSNGPFYYRLHVESPDHPWINGVWDSTYETSVDADNMPLMPGAIFEDDQSATMYVEATDRLLKGSPASESLTLVCCPM